MLQTPKVVFQTPAQDQLEMNDSCFCVDNHISLDQASQKPYIYDYDSQTNSEFAHNFCHQYHAWQVSVEHQSQS
nr:hypothetical protein Iba_chr10aCG7270 [Ipomoea batatas]